MNVPATVPPDDRSAPTYADIETDAQFLATRRRYRNFVVGASTFFVIWYAAYVLASSFGRDFMATPVLGNVNVGILWGFGQFVSTFLITGVYIAFTNRKITPAVEEMRTRWESQP